MDNYPPGFGQMNDYGTRVFDDDNATYLVSIEGVENELNNEKEARSLFEKLKRQYFINGIIAEINLIERVECLFEYNDRILASNI